MYMLKYLLVLNIIGFIYGQGGGYSLNISTTNYVDLGNILNFTYNDQLSIAYWFKVVSNEEIRISNRAACDNGSNSSGCHRGYSFLAGTDGLRFKLMNTWANNMLVVIVSESFDDNTWHYAVVTYDGSSDESGVNIYLDNVLKSHSVHTNTLSATVVNSLPLRIGGNGEDSGGSGMIDEVRIWNDVRTVSELQEYMHKEVASDASGLVAYYKMSNGSGTSLTDNSSNSYTGTLTNMDNADWVTSYAPIGGLGSSYETDVEAVWKASGTSESDASDGLTMTMGSALSTGNFAVFGNNNTSSGSTSDLGSVGSTYRTGRIWQVDESGTVTATIKIDMSDATGYASNTGTASNYRLLYRSGTSGDFSSAATGSSISGDVVTFNSFSLQDGYYALGAESDASLPVELTSFELMSTREEGITLQWITESEINNLGFILDRRTPTTDWTQIASYITDQELQGQGSVSYQTIYTYTDNHVQENETYDYRLADVDHDGNVEYHSTQLMGVSISSTLPEQYVLTKTIPTHSIQ